MSKSREEEQINRDDFSEEFEKLRRGRLAGCAATPVPGFRRLDEAGELVVNTWAITGQPPVDPTLSNLTGLALRLSGHDPVVILQG